jgi:hypothetical protein
MVSSIRRHTTSLSVERKMTRGETPRNPSTDEDPEKVSEKAACGSPDLRYHGDVPAFGPKPSPASPRIVHRSTGLRCRRG